MNILFTGHKGFLGKELISDLQAHGHNIITKVIDYCDNTALDNFILRTKIDFILHAAIRGGRRTHQDTSDILYNNITMFENLAHYGIPMINFCSGAAYGRSKPISGCKECELGNVIPADYYGLSKYIISMRCQQQSNITNLRFFNVFGPQETDDRFIKTNVRNYINKKNITIFKDKYMDFFGIEDTKRVVNFYIQNYSDSTLPACVNLVYPDRLSLTDIAAIINSLSDYTVNIVKNSNEWDSNYYGDGNLLASLDINLTGLTNEITNCYNYIKQANCN